MRILHLYLDTLRADHDGYHLFPEEMLFHLKDDRYEQFDYAKLNPWICQEARDKYTQWFTAMLNSMPEGYTIDSMETVLNEGGPYHAKGYLKQYCAQLEKTGRGWAIPELKKRHPQEFE
jgi:hypothetical protein